MEKKSLSVFLVAVCLVLCLGLLPVHGETKVYDSVVRLHVLANSDTEEDQALKLQVRDDLLVTVAALLEEASDREEAIQILSENLPLLRQTAKATLAAQGSPYDVTVTLGKEYYPTRTYDSLCFPCGTYVSLQVRIGEAEGKNWWCVLFPPLCLSAATARREAEAKQAFVAVGLTPEQYRIITESDDTTGRYQIRFKLLELWESFVHRIRS